MIKKIKGWFSKQVKKSLPVETEITEEVEEEEDVVAFFNLAIDSENNLVMTSDFIDGNESAMAKIVFLLCSGTLMELVGDVVSQRCAEDTKQRDEILTEAYDLIMKNLASSMNEEEDDDEPVVDPCNVFNPRMNEDDEERME